MKRLTATIIAVILFNNFIKAQEIDCKVTVDMQNLTAESRENISNFSKNIEDYIRLSAPVNFYTILEAASRKNDLAIGYKVISEENNSSKNFGVYLNPDKSRVINFSAGDSVIVLSEKK